MAAASRLNEAQHVLSSGLVLTDLGSQRWNIRQTKGGIEVIELIACEAPPSPYALSYLRTKKNKMGHSLTIM